MTDYTTYLNGEVISNASGVPAAGAGSNPILVAHFDASKRNLAAADTADIGNFLKGMLVRNVLVEIITVDASGTLDIGDEDDPNGWYADVSVATAGLIVNPGTAAYAAATPKLYTAQKQILLTAPTGVTLDTLKCNVYADVAWFPIAA